MKDEIQDIISGKSKVKHSHIIQSAISYLTGSQKAGEMAKGDQYFKTEETKRLVQYADANKLWIENISLDNFVSAGAEQRVYLNDGFNVLKLNDAIYYLSWIDYFRNLLLNNLFFPDTSYKLLGFYRDADAIYAVVEQPFVKATSKTDLSIVKTFMMENGFVNTRNNDYYNADLGIILEDLHDENVLTQNDMLYFIDTVFYISPER